MQRIFLDWNRPFIPQAAEWLLDRSTRASAHGNLADMRHVRCVTPGARAGRLLLGELARRSDGAGVELVPPRAVTPGALAGSILEIESPMATREERVLAWIAALRRSTTDEIAALLPTIPDDDDLVAWHDLARTLEALHEELAGADIAFADVPVRAEGLELFAEGDRWRALECVAARYRNALTTCGLAEPHAAQRDALVAGRLDPRAEIVLLAVPEMNAMQTAIVEALAERTVALVHASETFADRFDELGRPQPDAWAEATLTIADDQIEVAGGPTSQAQAVMQEIARLGRGRAPEAITIGVGDPELIGAVTRAAAWAGLGIHTAQGTPIARTAPARLLSAVADRLEDPGYATLAALLRHPDVERSFGDSDGATDEAAGAHLALLDRYFAEHLDPELSVGADDLEQLDRIRERADELVRPLSGAARPLADWWEPIVEILRRVYGHLDRDEGDGRTRIDAEACLALRETIARYDAADRSLQIAADGATAVRLLLAGIANDTLAADVEPDQVEMLGWLDLHLDSAPILVLTGCVEGRIPEAVHGGLFLPDVLRRVLGVADNRHRYARDAYLIEAIVRSREHAVIVAGRRDDRGEPLAPSRLLLACDDESMLARVRRLCAEDVALNGRPLGAPACADRSSFVVPDLPADLAVPAHLAVTDFGRYLACPYRYALAKLLKLESISDDVDELDAMAFGSLAHAVLDRFGRAPDIRDEEDAEKIADWLREALAAEVATRYGREPLPAVRLQVARLEERLDAFACVQAALRRDEWRIESTEFNLPQDARLEMPDGPAMPLRGRIDRIDRHERTGAVRIIDYKTGESGRNPHEVHHGGRRVPKSGPIGWLDLQLPLYDYLGRQSGLADEIELGYIVLPRKASDVAFAGAEWSRTHLDEAVHCAQGVVRDIRAGRFELNRAYGKRYDGFARICQTVAFGDDDDQPEAEESRP